MAKKKAVAKPVEVPSKARMELRLDNDVFDRIKRLADSAQISVNQLMQFLARWAGESGHVGEPHRDVEGFLRNKHQPGCIWIGSVGWKPEELDDEEHAYYHDEIMSTPVAERKGELKLFMDFTERRILRDDVE
ncbi:MAG TPA: hypothetical protein VGM98_16895 [Schlesneria sp.]|jgi:hypothetical protein